MIGAQVLASFVINHKYGISSVGEYALLLAVSQIVIVGVSMPFSSLIRRDLSLLGFKEAGSYIFNVNYFRMANTIITIVVAILIMPFFSASIAGIKLFLILMLLYKGLDMLNDTYFVTYQSLTKYRTYAALKISYAVLILASLAVIYISNLPIEFFYYSQVGIALLFFLFNSYMFRHNKMHYRGETVKKGINTIARINLLKEAWPMIINSLVSQASAKLNAIIIFHFIGAGDLGVFSVLLMFSNIFAGVGNSIGIVVISNFTILIEKSVTRFRIFFRKSLFLFFSVGIGMALLYAIFLPFLIKFYKFEMPGLLWLNIFIGSAIPFLFTTSCISNIFLILKKQIAGMYVSVVVLIINIVLYIGLSYTYNLKGAAYAYFIMALFQLCLILIWSFRILQKKAQTPNFVS